MRLLSRVGRMTAPNIGVHFVLVLLLLQCHWLVAELEQQGLFQTLYR